MLAVTTKRTRLASLLGVLLAAGGLALPGAARASGSQPFIGEISCGGWTFCPQGWAECAGQVISIAENDVLFALIGTTYGGDGQVNFALPNLSGRTMIGTGQGTGLSSRTIGESGGTETETLTTAQLPGHTHALKAQSASGDSASPSGKVVAGVAADDARYASSSNGALAAGAVSVAGSSQSHNNLQPYQAVKCCISLGGIFPSQ
jgi:microcystin-dependent protein